MEEYATKNRLYCSNPECSNFLGEKTSRPGGVNCRSCKTLTCGRCGDAHHGSDPCQLSSLVRETIILAQRSGWQRCPGCRTIVELRDGCRHVTCSCGTQFCYYCAAKWRSCNCTDKNYARNENYLVDFLPEYIEESHRNAKKSKRELLLRVIKKPLQLFRR